MESAAYHRVIATIAAHERVLTILLTDYLARLSPEQRVVLANAVEDAEGMLIPNELKLDLDSTDQLAAFAMTYQESVNRLFGSAFELADALKH